EGAGGAARAARALRARGRVVAPLLPEPAGLARDRRDRARGRHRRAPALRPGARARARRPRPRRRPADPREGREGGPRAREPRLVRVRDRPRDRGLMRAVNLLPKEEARGGRGGLRAPLIAGAAGALVVAAVIGAGAFVEATKLHDAKVELDS